MSQQRDSTETGSTLTREGDNIPKQGSTFIREGGIIPIVQINLSAAGGEKRSFGLSHLFYTSFHASLIQSSGHHLAGCEQGEQRSA